MYFSSLHGHGTSFCPASSGAPTECRQGTYLASVPILASTSAPVRAMIRIDATTYAESVISTPNIGFSAVSGPMQNGTTYSVRPRIEPRYSSVISAFICAGSIQLLVGPASFSSTEQMNVRCSTRATSEGSVRTQNEFGFFSSFSRTMVPASISSPVSLSYSASEPSTQWIRSGWLKAATSATQASRAAWRVGASVRSYCGATAGRGSVAAAGAVVSVWVGLAVVVIGGSFPLGCRARRPPVPSTLRGGWGRPPGAAGGRLRLVCGWC